MSVVMTKTNMVCAYEPEPDDLFVRVVWHGPPEEGGRYLRGFEGPPWPIAEYEATVAWAVEMADKMQFALHVVPMRVEQVLTPARLERALAAMTDQERGELRRFVVTTCCEVMRDCDDEDVRGEAFRVLAKMGVVDDE